MEKKTYYTDVLIVGAGPTGLMMACQLAVRKINFRIIDKKAGFPEYSGAMLLHSRTMEIFEQLGIVDSFLKKGTPVSKINFLFNNRKPIDFEIGSSNDATEYPGILLIKQSETEGILTNFVESLGYRIEKGVELTDFEQTNEEIISTINGKQVIKSKYLIGTDGAHSFVRKKLNIAFNGKTFPYTIFVLDSSSDIKLKNNEIHFIFNKKLTAGFFSFENTKWRIDGCLQKDKNNDYEEIKETLEQNQKHGIQNIEQLWFSNFILNQRIAKSFVQNNIFLAGDAAHVHSPAGAQGMNTGIHDSYNLAWKLALVLRNKARTNLLDTYPEERQKIARSIIFWTYTPFLLAISRNKLIKYIRLYLFPFSLDFGRFFLIHLPKIRKYLLGNLSGLNINYRGCKLSSEVTSGGFKKHSPKPGERWPFQLNGGGFNFTLVLFEHDFLYKKLLNATVKFHEIIKFEIIKPSPESKMIYKSLDIYENGFYLIRPDLYVAYRSKSNDFNNFRHYLEQFLL